MATYTGLFLKLKDKKTCITDKLKLAKFAWATDSVHIPNKHQQILDFVCGLLVNRKKHNITREDAVLVWETLNSFLCLAGSSSVIKPSIIQAIIDDLRLFTVKEKHQKKQSTESEFLLHTLRCSHKLLQLQSVTIFQFESLCTLLSVICELLVNPSLQPKMTTELQSLLQSVLAVLIKNQKSHLNQVQVLNFVTDRVLSIALKMLGKLPCTVLQEFLLGCLLHRDHRELYAAYLKYTFGESGQSLGHIKQAPKCIEKVFTVLSLQLTEIEPSASVSFLPDFMKLFVSQNKSEPRLCYLLLKHLIKMVTSPEGAAGRADTGDEWRIQVSAKCVETCHDCELFSASDETNDILKWFFQLTASVLEKQRTAAWFSYLRAALNLNHLIVEKFWGKILDLGFAKADQISEDCYAEQDLFLADLVSIYVKLRRTPDLLSVFLSSIEASASGADVFGHLPQFYDRLSHMFSEAPLGSLVDMWENLQAVSVKLIQLLKVHPEASTLICLHWTISFYTVLLGNARLFNHWGVGVLGQRMIVLMKQLEEQVLMVLNNENGITKHCPSVKDMLSVWAVVRILTYPKWRETFETLTEHSPDKMEESVKKLSQSLDSVSKLRLVVQRQTLASVTNPELTQDEGKRQTIVENIVEDLLDLPRLSRENVFKIWEDHGKSCTVFELPVQKFQQLTQIFPLIGSSLSGKLIDKLADVVVEVLSLATVQDMNSTDLTGTTLFTEVCHFLAHPATREVKIFQERLSLALWKSLLSGLDHIVLSPRKKKMKMETAASPSLAKVVRFLTASEFHADKCKLDLNHVTGSLKVLPHFTVMIKVLKTLDLEYLQEMTLRCQLGACILIASLRRSEAHEELRNDVVELLIRCLSIPNLSRLFECVKPTELLDFVISVGSQGGNLDCELVKVTVHAVMNDYEAVPSMVAYAKKLTEDLINSLQVDSIKMKVCAWIIQNCQRYVTKSFHITSIRNAAPEIFFCLAKFVIKHGLEWFEKAKLAQAPIKRTAANSEKSSMTKKRKREITEQNINNDDLDQKGRASLVTCEDSCTKAWCSLLMSLSGILHLWSKDIVDYTFNEHLAVMVTKMLKQVMADLKSDLVSTEVKVSELEFISACCRCHLRGSQTSSDDSSASPLPDQSTLTPSSDILCLLPGEQLEEVWASCLPLCVLEFSKQLRLSGCSKECSEKPYKKEILGIHIGSAFVRSSFEAERSSGHVDKKLSHKTAQVTDISCNSNLGQATAGLNQSSRGFLEHAGRWLDQMEIWPNCVVAYVEVLTAVLECSDVTMFRCFLNKMMESLAVPDQVEPSTVCVMMAVWRGLVKSQLLSDDLIQELFACMYQFLSIISSLVQYHENLKTLCPSSLSFASSELSISVHDSLRSVLDALSDFLDLGKKLITPRMTLLCLNAGLTFTMTCPSDLEALYRLINTLLIHHTNTALKAVPSIIHIANKLISACIELGSEEKINARPEMLKDLLRCTQLITRLLTLLSSSAYKMDLGKVAHSIIAEYVIGVQRGSLHTSVKKELVRGLYKVMSISDKFRLAALNASLPAGVKDNFKVLHQDYEKYHRYTGYV